MFKLVSSVLVIGFIAVCSGSKLDYTVQSDGTITAEKCDSGSTRDEVSQGIPKRKPTRGRVQNSLEPDQAALPNHTSSASLISKDNSSLADASGTKAGSGCPQTSCASNADCAKDDCSERNGFLECTFTVQSSGRKQGFCQRFCWEKSQRDFGDGSGTRTMAGLCVEDGADCNIHYVGVSSMKIHGQEQETMYGTCDPQKDAATLLDQVVKFIVSENPEYAANIKARVKEYEGQMDSKEALDAYVQKRKADNAAARNDKALQRWQENYDECINGAAKNMGLTGSEAEGFCIAKPGIGPKPAA